jgi:hypothetical protein
METDNKSSTRDEGEHDATVGIFPDQDSARNAISLLIENGIEITHISHVEHDVSTEAPDLHITSLDDVEPEHVVRGISKGATIGALAGLIGLAIPGLGLGAAITGALGGGLIGGMAAIDEAIRARNQPGLQQFQDYLHAGKSLLIVFGNEARRITAENCMKEARAERVSQYPPVLESIHPEQMK